LFQAARHALLLDGFDHSGVLERGLEESEARERGEGR